MYSFLLAFSILMGYCGKNNNGLPVATELFDSIPTIKPLVPLIDEISGIADSKTHPGYLWAHEDSGNPPQLFLVGYDGKVAGKVYLKGALNRDWEDMALAGSTIYIADIGDNNKVLTHYTIYRLQEPGAGVDTVQAVDAIKFQYPDGAHDAEAILVDPATKDIFIITKRDNPSKIYKLPYPYSTTEMNTAQLVGALPYSGVVSAALSKRATEIIVKTYTGLYYYTRKSGSTIAEALQQKFSNIPYKVEPQGEAVAFANDGSGYFTLSEKGFGTVVNLYFYKRQ